MLRQRLATAVVAIPLLIWLILSAPDWIYSSVVLFFTFVSLRELSAMQRVAISGATALTTGAGMTIAFAMLVD